MLKGCLARVRRIDTVRLETGFKTRSLISPLMEFLHLKRVCMTCNRMCKLMLKFIKAKSNKMLIILKQYRFDHFGLFLYMRPPVCMLAR